jgi:hypothetical protein
VEEDHLWIPADPFYNDKKTSSFGLMGDAFIRPHLIRRAWFGWLTDENVHTVTSSGDYDLYSDNDDMTVDPDKPVILQIKVTRSDGQPDFVFLTLPNLNLATPFAELDTSQTLGKDYYFLGYASSLSSGVDVAAVHLNGREIVNYSTKIYSSNYSEAAYGGKLQPGESIHMQWEGEDLEVTVLERTGNYARVRVTYANENSTPWRNPAFPEDVNADGLVTPEDLQIVYSYLIVYGSFPLIGEPDLSAGDYYLDPDGDNYFTSGDVQKVYAYLIVNS